MNEPLVPTAERTLRLVELLLSRPEGWMPQDLLVQLDLSRSALFVLLRGLKSLGYVEQSGRRGRYIAGPRLQAWRSTQTPGSQELVTAFYQELDPARETALADLPSETIALALPAGPEQTYGWIIAAQVESTQRVRSSYTAGQVLKSHAALQDILSPFPVEQIVDHGYALTTGDETIDLALPVCRDGRTPEAALLLSAPSFRWSEETLLAAYLEELRRTAAHLSYRIGAPLYTPFRRQSCTDVHGTSSLRLDEIGAFLRGPWAASLACIRPDGKPHVIPVWQEWDGKDFYLVAWRGSQWAEYLLENNRVSLTVDEPWIPLRRVVVQGCAVPFLAGNHARQQLVDRLSRRYLGQPAGIDTIEQVQRAFVIHPDSIRGWRGLPVTLNPGARPRSKGGK